MNRIRQLRELKKINQKELAQLISAKASSVCNWEKGSYKPNEQQILKLCEVFDCTPDYLLGYTDINLKQSLSEDNTITIYERGGGAKRFKVSPKKIAAIKALLDDDGTDDIDF